MHLGTETCVLVEGPAWGDAEFHGVGCLLPQKPMIYCNRRRLAIQNLVR